MKKLILIRISIIYLILKKIIGTLKPDTKSFRLKGTGSMGSNKLPEHDSLTKFAYDCLTCKRETVPKIEEKPIMGLKSNKNFIISNAVENILSGNNNNIIFVYLYYYYY